MTLFNWKVSLCFLLIISFSFTPPEKSASPVPVALAGSRPNILLIVIDDLGYNDLQCFDNPYIKTPHINQLAQGGIKATQGYVNSGNCAPTRAALMSGLYPPRTGVYTVGTAERGKTEDRRLMPVANKQVLGKEFVTMAEMLSRNGYNTCMGGKWHLGDDEYSAGARGFQKVLMGGGREGNHKSVWPPYGVQNAGTPQDSTYITDYLTSQAVDYISRAEKDKPFFLYLPHYVVHTPVDAPPALKDEYKTLLRDEKRIKPQYAAMIANLDMNVGRLMQALRENNLEENTLVIFMSDNGPHAPSSSWLNLRGTKGSMYEGGARVPYIFYWKGKLQPAATTQPFIGLDLYPTFMELAGITKNSWPKLDGQSLVSMLENPSGYTKERTLFWHFPAYLEGGNEKRGWRQTPASSIRVGDWKLIENFEYKTTELYDLKSDPKETTDLSKTNPAKTKELLDKLHAWQRQTKAFIPTKVNPGYRREVAMR